MKKINTLFVLLGTCFHIQSQSVIFVNKNVQGGLQNGTSWTNAFSDLQQALAAAVNVDEIWAAAGTYYPTATTDRSISFVLKQGVKMYGGFNGTETAFNQRDFELNETVLSGNIGTPAGNDNSYHILYGKGVDSATVVDGFVISRGGATDAVPFPHFRGGGLYLEHSPNLYNTCPVIQNCRFEFNSATSGAAIYCSYDFGNVVNPDIRNCTFVHNRAATFAGALYKGGPAPPDRPFVIENCHFLKNAAFTSEGGGAYFANVGNTTILRNCTFEKDSAKASWGAGFYYGGSSSAAYKLVLDSCTFKENYGSEGAGFTFVDIDGSSAFYCDITNSRFEKNKTRDGEAAAFLLLGFSKSKIETNILSTVFIDNLSRTNSTTNIQGGFESDITVNIKACSYLNNKNSNNPNGYCFAILAGVAAGESKCRVNIENSLFADNGSGVAVLSSEAANTQTNITNCTFYRNNEFIVGKSWYPGFDTSDTHRSDCYITNCVFWEPGSATNQMFTNNDFMNVNMRDYHIDHTLINFSNFNIPGSTGAFGDDVIFGTYPMFADTANGDFRLLPCSPAVNKGDNLAADTIGLVSDLDGNPRIYRDTVDMGAYEVQDSCFTINSTEPEVFSGATLLPNPVAAGEVLSVRLLKNVAEKLVWKVIDVAGKQISEGSIHHSMSAGFNIVAPRESGLYFLQLQGRSQAIQLKFVVGK